MPYTRLRYTTIAPTTFAGGAATFQVPVTRRSRINGIYGTAAAAIAGESLGCRFAIGTSTSYIALATTGPFTTTSAIFSFFLGASQNHPNVASQTVATGVFNYTPDLFANGPVPDFWTDQNLVLILQMFTVGWTLTGSIIRLAIEEQFSDESANPPRMR